MGLPRTSAVVSAAERRLKAYHEAGHVIVARASPAARPVEKVTIVPHGGTAGGLTVLSLDDESLPSRDAILAQLDVAMGGRAAERLAVGSSAVTTGAEADLRVARDLAVRMVTQWGYGDAVGLGGCDVRALSPHTRRRVDDEVRAILSGAHARALGALRRRRRELDALATALLRDETLSATQIDAALAGASRGAGGGGWRARLGLLAAERHAQGEPAALEV